MSVDRYYVASWQRIAQEDEPVEIQAEAVQQVLQGEMIEIVDFLGNGAGDPAVAKEQFLKEMESLVRLELGFAFRVCEWSDEEKFPIHGGQRTDTFAHRHDDRR